MNPKRRTKDESCTSNSIKRKVMNVRDLNVSLKRKAISHNPEAPSIPHSQDAKA